MNTLKLTSQFKKDLKRYKHKTEVIDKLEAILKLLAEGLSIPEEKQIPSPLGDNLYVAGG